ncbi:hypothetical protein VTH82DRAFT_1620 [Thermothelomyces myriococcoides]
MATRSSDTAEQAVEQAAEQPDVGTGNAEESGASPPKSTSPLSPPSCTASTPLSSTFSPLPSVSLAEQASTTPLSVNPSDTSSPSDPVGGAKRPVTPQGATRLLTPSKSMEALRRTGNLSRNSGGNSTSNNNHGSTVPVASAAVAGPTPSVSAMVESFEELHRKNSNSNLGYELLRTKSAGRQRPAALVSPPSTLPHSPSASCSPSPSPANNESVAGELFSTEDGLGAAADQQKPGPQESENGIPPQTAAAATSNNPAPSAPASDAAQAHDGPSLPASSALADPPSPRTVVADTALVRPTPSAGSSPQRHSRTFSNPFGQPIVRSSSDASVSLSHPTPDSNKLSQAGSYLGNIAALEATAERMSMTSSIEDAIREEHNELKRSESRRSSILRARATSVSDNGSVHGQGPLSATSRQNSILGINSAARSGGYSPGGFVMNPNHHHHSTSSASGRLRSGSKASSTGLPPNIPEDADTSGAPADHERQPEYRFLPRHGPGKASTKSVASRISLAQIAELEHPTTLTKEAFDEADRAAAAGGFPDVDDDIRNSARQIIEAEFASGADEHMPEYHGFYGEPTRRLQLHQPDQYEPQHYGGHRLDDDRPTTSGSGTTYEQAQAAFGDFDGVHCDPDTADSAPQPGAERRQTLLPPQPVPGPQPTTYIDPVTGQQMLYYPAPVPAMLNLPPKLSKKPKKPARDARHSQLASAAPKPARESRFQLPDPTAPLRGSEDGGLSLGSMLGKSDEDQESTPRPSGTEEREASYHAQAGQREIRQPPRLTDRENRKSRPMPADGMPPQLRASAFFELPPEAPQIPVQGGSATDTLDTLLDASTVAPVSAFTDHVFAGKLGAEVYGPAKKKRTKKAAPQPAEAAAPDAKAKRRTLVKRNSSGALLEQGAEDDKPKRRTLVKRNSSGNLLDPNSEKKRATRFSLFGTKSANAESDNDNDDDDRQKSGRNNEHEDDDSRSESASSDQQLVQGEADEGETETEEEEPVYQGPPTTLLAELQLRKQQDKQRTRPVTSVDGMRTTLLELNAVAEVERKARHGKRVTLAWEDTAAAQHRQEEEEDEDVPLGMLLAAKAAAPGGGANRATMDISTLMSEVHRPLGLMERRELEENEPLSRRRARLQGRLTEELPTSLTALQKRISHMPGAAPMGMRSQSRLNLPLPQGGGSSRAGSMVGSRPGSAAGTPGEDVEPEIEGETLAARKARLAAENPLPVARPVSSTFSAELLREFGPEENNKTETEETEKKANQKNGTHSRTLSRDTAAVPEEEETLGQRRRRLQREREAREREMAFNTLNGGTTPLGFQPPNGLNAIHPATRPGLMPLVTPSAAPSAGLSQVLNTVGSNRPMTMDPREQERLRREAEAAQRQREMDAKMAVLRAQMPTSLATPSTGARSGGFMGGMFNDGSAGARQSLLGGGGGGMQRPMTQYHHQQQQQQRTSTLLGPQVGSGMYGGSTPNLGVYPNGAGPSLSVNALPSYGMPVGAGGQGGGGGGGGHMDMVERWRQGVMP